MALGLALALARQAVRHEADLDRYENALQEARHKAAWERYNAESPPAERVHP